MDEVERRLQVHVDDHVPLLLAHAHHQSVARDAGIVDQHVDPAEILDDLGYHGGRVLEIGRVRRVSLSLNAEGLQLLFGVLKVLVDFQIGENDRGAFLRETQRDRLADAAGGSGYDGDFSFK